MPIRLSKIDDLTRPDHTFIEAADECLYLGEYTARKGYQFSDTNNLIFNFQASLAGGEGMCYSISPAVATGASKFISLSFSSSTRRTSPPESRLLIALVRAAS